MAMKSTTASNTYVVEPAILDRFPVDLARRIAHELLMGAYGGQSYSTEKTKGVADTLRDRLKCALYVLRRGFAAEYPLLFTSPYSLLPTLFFYNFNTALGVPRYKIFVQVTVFEAKAQGARIASRALWNTSTDFFITEIVSNDSLQAVATIAVVYTP